MRAPLISKVAIAVALATAASASVTTTAAAGTKAVDTAIADAARSAAFAHASQTGLTGRSGLVATDVMTDPDGAQHVRFSQTYRGLPVVGADIVVHLTASSGYLGVTRASDEPVSVPTVAAKVTAKQARDKAASVLSKGTASAPRLIVRVQHGRSVLAYETRVAVNGDAAASRKVVLDASTGSVISDVAALDGFISPKLERRLKALGERAAPSLDGSSAAAKPEKPGGGSYPAPAVGTGLSMYSGTVTLNTTRTAASAYTLVDGTRGKAEIRDAKNRFLSDSRVLSGASVMTDSDNTWGNGTTSDTNTAGVDAQYGLASTFDFYKNTLGRTGIRDDGVGPAGVVHFGTNFGNAGWSDGCWCMVYGDGDGVFFAKPLTQLDITGHELTHGVVSATAGLEAEYTVYDDQIGEAGSLNESLADIFGTAVEFSTNNTHAPNYLMGEQLGLTQGFLRRMDRPSLDALEGAVDYWTPNAPQTEVHAGSGVSSHAFYLLAEGSGSKTINGVAYNSPTYDGSTVTGIGRDKAVAIFYQALTRYMVSSTDFHDARTATLQAAADLYGQGSTEYTTVDKAWAAVNVTAANG
jgi:Zn-dependent metalloprotease